MKRILITAAIATAFSASSAMAVSFSSASLSNYKVTLVDLDLEDGITPSINFTSTTFSNLSASVRTLGTDEYKNAFSTNNGDGLLPQTITENGNTASASLSGNNINNQVLQVSGSSLGSSVRGNQFGYTSTVYDEINYILSPNTQLNITADAFNYVETTDGRADANEYAYSYASLALYEDDFINDADAIELTVEALVNGPTFKLSELTLLNVAYENIGEQEYAGSVVSYILNYGDSYAELIEPNPVPVPAALPLMASALGLFGLSRRKN